MTRKQRLINYINQLKEDNKGLEVYINNANVSFGYSRQGLDDAIRIYTNDYDDNLVSVADSNVQVVYYEGI